MILLFHSKNIVPKEMQDHETLLFYNGSIAVEFFFIVSGYYFANSCIAGRRSPQSIMWHKIKVFILPVWCSWGIAFVVKHVVKGNFGVAEILKDILKGIYEPLLIWNGGFVGKSFDGVVWYISALILTMALIVIPLCTYKDKYIYIIAPVIAVFGLGYLSHKYESVRNASKWDVITYKSQIRAIADVNLGIFVYGLKKAIDEIGLSQLGKSLLTVFEGGIYIFVILFMHYGHVSGMDFAVIILIASAVLSSMVQKTFLADLADCVPSIASFLGRYSLYIYLNQAVCWWIVAKIFPDKTYSLKLIIYLIATFIISFDVMYIVTFMEEKILPHIKRALLAECGKS